MRYGKPAGRRHIIAGAAKEPGIGHLLLQGHESKMSHATTMRSIELIGKKVIPALAEA